MYTRNYTVTNGLSWLAVISLFIPLSAAVYGGDVISPMNGKALGLSDSPRNYSFLVAGHIYPTGLNYSLRSTSQNIAMINDINASFLVFLGDCYEDDDPGTVDEFNRSILSRIEIPVFNAVGNHDGSNYSNYAQNFGESFYSFRTGSEFYIVLDTVRHDLMIKGDQLVFLRDSLLNASNDSRIKNVFIFTHHLIWCGGNTEVETVCDHANIPYNCGNTHFRCVDGTINNFNSTIMPDLIKLSKEKKVYLISGDLGKTFPLFYHHDKRYDIHYMACGLGSMNGLDSLVKIDIYDNGSIEAKPITLTGLDAGDLESYGVSYWAKLFEKGEMNNTVSPDGIDEEFIENMDSLTFWGSLAGILLVMLIFALVYAGVGRIKDV